MKEEDIFKQKRRLVGGLVPQPLANTLSLYCIYTGQTRSKIISSLLQQKLEKSVPSDMITAIGSRLSLKLKGLVVSKQNTFLAKVRVLLQKKNIHPTHIEQILTKARQIHAENKDKEEK